VVVVALSGCAAPGAREATGPTQTDRFVRTYPELRGGRFVVLADFEDARQMGMFRCAAASAEAACTLDPHGAPSDTGSACLRFTAGNGYDAVLAGNQTSAEWFLPRDWRDYDLLLLRLRADAPGIRADLAVSAGSGSRQCSAETALTAGTDWTLFRLDLAEIGEQVPLDDIRALQLTIRAPAYPVNLWVDDIFLAGARESVFGDPANTAGELYVQRVGRRWNVGAGGRFELTFGNGQIVRWFNLTGDPQRLHNLVEGTSLGPTVVTVRTGPDGATVEPAFIRPDSSVSGRQQVLEMSRERVVVECTWWLPSPEGSGAAGPSGARGAEATAPVSREPRVRWIYTVYAGGQVYVDVAVSGSVPAQEGVSPGLAVSMSGGANCRMDPPAGTWRQAAAAPAPAGVWATLQSSRAEGTGLAYAVARAELFGRMTTQTDGTTLHALAVATAESSLGEVWGAPCMIALATAGDATLENLPLRAGSYVRPPLLRFQTGRPATTEEAGTPVDPTGFDPASGCYVITPLNHQVRFTVDQQAAMNPRFRVLQEPGRQAWVYVDQRLVEEVTRDRHGDLLVHLPDTLLEDTLVEVIFSSGGDGAAASRP